MPTPEEAADRFFKELEALLRPTVLEFINARKFGKILSESEWANGQHKWTDGGGIAKQLADRNTCGTNR